MKLQVFSVFDKAVGAYLQPFFTRAKGEAMRSFADAANSKDHNFHQHASDYVLMYLGEFDDSSGMFECVDPVRLVGAHELIVDDVLVSRTSVNGGRDHSRTLPG